MQAVLPVAGSASHETHLGIEIKQTIAEFPRGLQLLTDSRIDFHCGGVYAAEPLPRS